MPAEKDGSLSVMGADTTSMQKKGERTTWKLKDIGILK